tara:strand:- start:6057 stop:6377 length:321 start_codon:yes stop_codon:yes gene_type:complete
LKEEAIFTVHIGETDIFEWSQGIGKTVLMPILLEVCGEVIYSDIEEKIAARVNFLLKGKPKIYDFVVTQDGVWDTLNKILKWTLEEEEYEMSQKVKVLQDYLADDY